MEAIVNNLVKAIGWSILHSLWQGAIIFVLLFVLLVIRPKTSARLKHNLAFGALLLIFGTFCFTLFSVFEFPTVNNLKNIALNQTAIQDLSQFTTSLNLRTEAYFPIVGFVYIIGITFQLIVLLYGYAKLKQLKKANTFAIPEAWKVIFEMTTFQLKINRKIGFYLSENVNVPLVIGFFKPVVLFPFSLATQLDSKQVEAILIHELSHIRRNDYLINLVKTCIETLLFFNPFVWLTTRFIQIEREHACDDLVVKATGTPLTYAHALLKLELLKNKQTPTLSLAATGKNQHLYQRIKRITDMKTNYINAKQQFFILTLAIATIASLAWINPTKEQEVKTKKKTTLTLLKSTSLENKTINDHLTLKADTDTVKIKAKKRARIIITEDNGNVKTYNSISEMPDSLRELVVKSHFIGDSIAKFYNSKKWKDQMAKINLDAAQIKQKFESKEWKDKIAKIEFDTEKFKKTFESKEWKDQIAKMEFNTKEIEKKFNSPEWKSQIAEIQKNALENAKKYQSKEWKNKIEELKKLKDLPEYKKLKKKFDSDLEELKKQKGIKTDKAFLFFDEEKDLSLPLALDLKTALAATMPIEFKSLDLNFDNSNLKLEKLRSPLEKTPSKALKLNNMVIQLNTSTN